MDNLNLIIPHYLGELDDDDKQKIDLWLQKPDNKQTYDQYVRIWKISSSVKCLDEIDLNKSWKQLLLENKKKQRNSIGFSIATIAASILMFLASWWFLMIDKGVDYRMVINSKPNSVKEVSLADGSIVYLNYNAKLEYPKQFNTEYRNVKLSGNAFFRVAKDSTRPFTVKLKDLRVSVLGTSFDINELLDYTEIVVKTGKVRVESIDFDENSIVLLPNEKLICRRAEMIKTNIEDENYIAWMTGIYKFSSTSLSDVFKILKKGYNIKYKFANEKIEIIPLTAEFREKNIDDIIEIIQLCCQIKIVEKNNILIIKEYE
ncbi:MAG: FecR domain-containing protein [Marinifilaceae bacterium]|jgi:ferric-dicitrate binding protein FerR (iron transport regulator)|nr:FecR domain-containing protein [Marinifilaceae bacterium]